MVKNIVGLFFLLLLRVFSVSSQVSVNSGTGNLSNDSIVFQYTMGEVIHHTASDSEWTVIAGIQQGYEILAYSALENISLDVNVQLYPNPAVEYLELYFGESSQPQYTGVFFDNKGQVIRQVAIEAPKSRLAIGDLVAGTYILQIKTGNTVVKMFKVIKK